MKFHVANGANWNSKQPMSLAAHVTVTEADRMMPCAWRWLPAMNAGL